MRSLLASLALLLLALSRQSSAGPKFTVESFTSKTASSKVSIISSKKADVVKQKMVKPAGDAAKETIPEEQIGKLMDIMGNTLAIIALGHADVGEDDIAEFYQKALWNGFLCEYASVTEDQIKQVAYPGGFSDAQHAEELQEVGDAIKCPGDATREDAKCFCAEKKPFLFCLMKNFKIESIGRKDVPQTARTCLKPALAALKAVGPTLFTAYDLDVLKNDAFADLFSDNEEAGIDAITKQSADEATKFFCDALNPAVEKAMIDVYAADGTYWFAEGLLYALIFGPAETDIDEACSKDTEFNGSDYGKCVCRAKSDQGTGFSFCIYKVLAEFFKTKGFLDCGANKFAPANKPKSLPQILPKPSKMRKKSSAATTAFSLLVPLAAAAAMLLRH